MSNIDYKTILLESISYNPLDSRNRILYRALYYIKLKHYRKTIKEKYPLDAIRAQHYGLVVKTYREYNVYTMSRQDTAIILRRLKQNYRQLINKGDKHGY